MLASWVLAASDQRNRQRQGCLHCARCHSRLLVLLRKPGGAFASEAQAPEWRSGALQRQQGRSPLLRRSAASNAAAAPVQSPLISSHGGRSN